MNLVQGQIEELCVESGVAVAKAETDQHEEK